MLPTRKEAMALIRDGLSNNPGPWGKHCLTAAHCAEKIAAACGDMDAEKAYVLGLLHDIGKKIWRKTSWPCFRWVHIYDAPWL